MALPVLSLQLGLINLGPGTYHAESIVHCEEDGELSLNFKSKIPGVSDTRISYVMTAGEDRGIYDVDTVEIISGVFTMARQ